MGIFENMAWGFCRLDLLALIFIAAVVVGFFVDRHRLNKKIKELKDQL